MQRCTTVADARVFGSRLILFVPGVAGRACPWGRSRLARRIRSASGWCRALIPANRRVIPGPYSASRKHLLSFHPPAASARLSHLLPRRSQPSIASTPPHLGFVDRPPQFTTRVSHHDTAMGSNKFSFKPLTLSPINFSLTEGTSIPAPLDSPPESPRPPTPGKGPLSSHPTPKSPGSPPQTESPPPGKASEDSADGHLQQSRTSDATSAMSPTSPSSKRPASVRKFLGIRTLSSNDSLKSDQRPGSPATINSQAPSLSRRKSGSWFGKRKTFISGSVPEGTVDSTTYSNGRTVSQPAVQAAQPPKPKGPPPPALPGLSSFGVNEDTLSLGADDMFKNIGKADTPKSTRW